MQLDIPLVNSKNIIRTGVAISAGLALAGCATQPAAPIDSSKIPVNQTFGHSVSSEQPLAQRPIVQTNQPAVLSYYADKPWLLMKFRPNINLPEFVDADVINGNRPAGLALKQPFVQGGRRSSLVLCLTDLTGKLTSLLLHA